MSGNRKRQSSGLCVSEADNLAKRETEMLEGQVNDSQKNFKVVIFSPDRFVRDFLQGILLFQGYPCLDVGDGQEVFWNMTPHPDQVVFLDGLNWLGHESEPARHRVREFIQAGMNVMVLADQRWDAELVQTWKVSGCRVLWKPLDYRQVGQVMAQI